MNCKLDGFLFLCRHEAKSEDALQSAQIILLVTPRARPAKKWVRVAYPKFCGYMNDSLVGCVLGTAPPAVITP